MFFKVQVNHLTKIKLSFSISPAESETPQEQAEKTAALGTYQSTVREETQHPMMSADQDFRKSLPAKDLQQRIKKWQFNSHLFKLVLPDYFWLLQKEVSHTGL